MHELHMVISLANIVVLIIIFLIFFKNYREIKSKFTLGLVLFVGIMSLSAIFSCPILFSLTGASNCPHESYHFSASVFQFFGLLIFLYIVYR